MRPSAPSATLLAALAVLAAGAPGPVSGQVGLVPRIGSTGVGADLGIALGSWLVVRGGGSVFPYQPRFTFADIRWEAEIPISAGVAADLHLGGSPFRISGGVFHMMEPVTFRGLLQGTVDVGGEEWSRSEVGDLQGSVEYDVLSPFASIGFGKAAGEGTGLFLEAGAALLGRPDVELDATGPVREDPGFQAAREREEAELEDDLADARFYPILTLGIRIGF